MPMFHIHLGSAGPPFQGDGKSSGQPSPMLQIASLHIVGQEVVALPLEAVLVPLCVDAGGGSANGSAGGPRSRWAATSQRQRTATLATNPATLAAGPLINLECKPGSERQPRGQEHWRPFEYSPKPPLAKSLRAHKALLPTRAERNHPPLCECPNRSMVPTRWARSPSASPAVVEPSPSSLLDRTRCRCRCPEARAAA